MKTQLQGIPRTVGSPCNRPIPTQTATALPLILRLAAAHAAVLEDWNRQFALDLRWRRTIAVPQ
jgi:hypothetical protein